MFDDVVVLTAEEYDAYAIACFETEFGSDYPDASDFVTDEDQRFFDARARLLSSGAAQLEAAVEADREAAVAAATRARALAAFARNRPAAMFDRVPGERGAASADSVAARPGVLTEVSEWAVDEAAVMLRISGRTASLLLIDAVTLVEGLPATLAALAAGDISPAHAHAMVEIAGPVSTLEKRAEVEAAVLPRAPQQTVPALRACARRAVARIDAAAAAERLATAVRDRQVRLDSRDDGMSALTTLLTTPAARACYEALSAYAKACEFDDEGDRDPRTHQQRMADCLTDLVLRPHADHPAVQLVLTLVAGVDTLTGQGPDAGEPGEVDGDLVPASLVRELAYTLGLLPRPAPGSDHDGGSTSATGATDTEGSAAEHTALGNTSAEQCHPADDAGEQVLAARSGEPEVARADPRTTLAQLLDVNRLAGTALAERPHIAVVDRLSGALLALTDSTRLRRAASAGCGLGPPPRTEGYRPSEALHRFVKLRDRRCRFPGCRARARCCDLDHQVPHPQGPTAHDNLACLCEHHHRLSHQAPGWRLHRDHYGGLVWTLPGGHTVTTRPPSYGTDNGSTPRAAAPRTGLEKYAEALAAIGGSTSAPADPFVPF